MVTMTIEYNEKDRYAMQVLTDLINSGAIHCKNGVKKHVISSFKAALHETMAMSADIAKNGTDGYKTLDDLLNED
jgi:hypothetical protein